MRTKAILHRHFRRANGRKGEIYAKQEEREILNENSTYGRKESPFMGISRRNNWRFCHQIVRRQRKEIKKSDLLIHLMFSLSMTIRSPGPNFSQLKSQWDYMLVLFSFVVEFHNKAGEEKLTSEIKVTQDCVQFCARAITIRYVVCPSMEDTKKSKENRIKTVNMKRKIIRFMSFHEMTIFCSYRLDDFSAAGIVLCHHCHSLS